MNGVGSERLGVDFRGDLPQGAGAGVVDHDREHEHDEGPDGEPKVEVMAAEEDAVDGLVDDPDGGGEHEAGLDEGGERLDLAVAIVVVFVGGAIGGAHGEEGDGGGDHIDAGMRGF